MKKILLIITMLLSINLFAVEGSTWYVGVKTGIVGTESASYFSGQESMGDVVGEGGIRNELIVGGLFTKKYSNLASRPYLYAWKNNADKNNELGFGLGFDVGFFNENTMYSIGGKVGIGTQDTSGKTFMTDNGVSNASFATSSSYNTPTEATYLKDNEVVEFGLSLNVDHYFSNNVSINIGAAYLMSSYAFSYSLPNGQVAQLSGIVQDNYTLTVGLGYNF